MVVYVRVGTLKECICVYTARPPEGVPTSAFASTLKHRIPFGLFGPIRVLDTLLLKEQMRVQDVFS